MVMAAHLSADMGLIDAAFVKRLTGLIERAGLPIKGPVLDAQDNAGHYLAHMLHDKKSVAGDIQFVLMDGPGKARVSAAPQAMVRAVIDRCCA
jgi:3-dehydroquinate synthase